MEGRNKCWGRSWVWASGPEVYGLLTQETASLGPGMRQVPGIKNKESVSFFGWDQNSYNLFGLEASSAMIQ